MHRTQVYLDQGQYELLKARARREGRSLAAVIRDSIDAYFGGSATLTAQDPFRRVIGIGSGDGSAVAENYEDFLYGEKN
ncbi:MAG: ribbon-helix-helix domain-containing protein [Acidobacteriia bacterium]|nr:ribbon-helix-helix domain-containing protein [Terriglobia bacterium]